MKREFSNLLPFHPKDIPMRARACTQSRDVRMTTASTVTGHLPTEQLRASAHFFDNQNIVLNFLGKGVQDHTAEKTVRVEYSDEKNCIKQNQARNKQRSCKHTKHSTHKRSYFRDRTRIYTFTPVNSSNAPINF